MWWDKDRDNFSFAIRILIFLIIFSVSIPTLVSAYDITGPTTITQPGLYNVVNDINCTNGYCINVGVSGVTIDGKSHSLIGSGNNTGIYSGKDDLIVQNIVIDNFWTGVNINWGQNLLNNITLINNNQGIWISDGDNNFIKNSKFLLNNIGVSYSVNNAKNSAINENLFNNNVIGIKLSGGNSGNSLQVFNNTFKSNTISGVSVDNSGLNYCGYGYIYTNYFENNQGNGIQIVDSVNDTINNNTIASSYNGISLEGNFAKYNQIHDNKIRGSLNSGIYLKTNTNGNDIWNNICMGSNNSGIQCVSSTGNNIANNILSHNTQAGIYLSSSSDNKISNNTIEGNENYGVILTYSTNNQFINNKFKNTNNANIPTINSDNLWNTTNTTGPNIIGGKYIGGNYWANPSGSGYSETCTDSDGDGFCDDPYSLATNNIDNLPLHASTVTHTITASAGSGGTISPSGVISVAHGASRTFTITSSTGYQIENVLVDGSSAGTVSTYTFTNVTSDHTISASFSQLPPITHNITATAGAGGSISPSGTVTVTDGGNQIFTITPGSGYLIQSVVVDGSSVGAVSSYTFTNVKADHTISASFSQTPPVTHTIVASAGSGGRIIPNGSVQVTAGANQTFTISNNLGMNIDDVLVDNQSQGAIHSYTFYNVSANHTISATFKVVYPTTWIINATAGKGGSIDPSGLVRVFNRYNQSFLITALPCYDITEVIINKTFNLGSQASPFQYNFINVTSNQSIEAQFTEKTYTINATSGKGGEITPSGEVSVPCGDSQTFTINPNTNYEVTSVLVDGLEKGAIRSYTFSNVTGDHEISAFFTRIPGTYEINATADQYTIVYPNGISKYPEGSNSTYLTQARPGSDLTSVNVDNTSYAPDKTWTFTNITSDHSIATLGNYTPGQVHVLFTVNLTWGQAPLTVRFTDQSVGDPTSWFWQFGDGTTSTSRNPEHTYQVPGIYTVTLSAQNSESGGVGMWNNLVTATEGVIPKPTPVPPPGQITAAFIAIPVTGSAPLDVGFQDQSSGNPVSWIWYFGDGEVSTLQNPVHQYTSAGSYSVTLLAQNAEYSGSLSKTGLITVN